MKIKLLTTLLLSAVLSYLTAQSATFSLTGSAQVDSSPDPSSLSIGDILDFEYILVDSSPVEWSGGAITYNSIIGCTVSPRAGNTGNYTGGSALWTDYLGVINFEQGIQLYFRDGVVFVPEMNFGTIGGSFATLMALSLDESSLPIGNGSRTSGSLSEWWGGDFLLSSNNFSFAKFVIRADDKKNNPTVVCSVTGFDTTQIPDIPRPVSPGVPEPNTILGSVLGIIFLSGMVMKRNRSKDVVSW